jgi:hypothetical protein
MGHGNRYEVSRRRAGPPSQQLHIEAWQGRSHQVVLPLRPAHRSRNPGRERLSHAHSTPPNRWSDYIETLTDKDVSDDTVIIVPALDRKVSTVREQLAAADRQQQQARNSYRALAADLRAAGLSVSDTAAILGVSRGRVSQLSKAS